MKNMMPILTASKPQPNSRLRYEKSHYYPPLHSNGGGGAFFAALKSCLIKTSIALTLSSNAHWKWRFMKNPRNQKTDLFRELFFIFKLIFCLGHLGIISVFKKASFGPQSVWIRINLSSNMFQNNLVCLPPSLEYKKSNCQITLLQEVAKHILQMTDWVSGANDLTGAHTKRRH
jgi:hypothetical protein